MKDTPNTTKMVCNLCHDVVGLNFVTWAAMSGVLQEWRHGSLLAKETNTVLLSIQTHALDAIARFTD